MTERQRRRQLGGQMRTWAAVWFGLTMVAGCQTLTGPRVAPMRDDIVAVRQYYAAEPWIRDDEGRVIGICARVYFLAAAAEDRSPKGVFVPGTIRAVLHVLTPRPDGTSARELVHEWTFDAEQSRAFRVSKTSTMGDSYGLFLRWPPELDLMGREVQITFSYQKQVGEAVARRGSRFRVPVPAGRIISPPAKTAPGGPASAPAPRDRPTSAPTPARGSQSWEEDGWPAPGLGTCLDGNAVGREPVSAVRAGSQGQV